MPKSLAPVLDFLTDLRAHNNREWFAANKPRYEQARLAFESLIEGVIMAYNSVSPVHGLQVKDCVFRINRDVRFSADKSPYRTNMGAVIGPGGRKGRQALGLYVHLEPGGCFAGGGIYMPEPEQLKRIREALAEDARPLRAIIAAPDFKKQFRQLQGDALKTPPRGFAGDHPDLDLLRHKQFLALRPFTDTQVLAPGYERELMAVARALQPFSAYFDRIMGA